MEKITHEQMEKMYREATQSSDFPEAIITQEPVLRKYFGDELVDHALITGIMQYLNLATEEDGDG